MVDFKSKYLEMKSKYINLKYGGTFSPEGLVVKEHMLQTAREDAARQAADEKVAREQAPNLVNMSPVEAAAILNKMSRSAAAAALGAMSFDAAEARLDEMSLEAAEAALKDLTYNLENEITKLLRRKREKESESSDNRKLATAASGKYKVDLDNHHEVIEKEIEDIIELGKTKWSNKEKFDIKKNKITAEILREIRMRNGATA